MCAFEERDGNRRYWIDGDMLDSARTAARCIRRLVRRLEPKLPIQPMRMIGAQLRPGTPLPLLGPTATKSRGRRRRPPGSAVEDDHAVASADGAVFCGLNRATPEP